MTDSRLATRITTGVLSSGLVAGAIIAGPPAAGAAIERRAAAADQAAMPSHRAWQSRLIPRHDASATRSGRRALASNTCRRWGPFPGNVNYLVFVKDHVDDYVKGRGGANCDRAVQAIGTDITAAKNGNHIPQLDAGAVDTDTDQVISPFSNYATYQCGNCGGTWVSKHTTIYKKYGANAILPPDPPMECNTIKDSGVTVIGWSCLIADITPVP
jgi:hypothetical protein